MKSPKAKSYGRIDTLSHKGYCSRWPIFKKNVLKMLGMSDPLDIRINRSQLLKAMITISQFLFAHLSWKFERALWSTASSVCLFICSKCWSFSSKSQGQVPPIKLFLSERFKFDQGKDHVFFHMEIKMKLYRLLSNVFSRTIKRIST